MSLQLSITLSRQTYERLQRYAHAQNQNIAEAVAEYLEENPPALPSAAMNGDPLTELRQEKESFMALYPTLRKRYMGQYVAIYHGQLLDHDANYSVLYERLRRHYPHQVIWISQIQETALPDIVIRSPRLEPMV